MAFGRRRSDREDATRTVSAYGEWSVPQRFNFARDVIERLAADPSRRALTHISTDGIVERQTFADVARGAAVWASILRDRGLQPGDRVMVHLGKRVGWHGALLGGLKAGLVMVPCSDMLRAADLAYRVHHSGARFIVGDARHRKEIEAMQATLEYPVDVLWLTSEQDLLRGRLPAAPTYDTAHDDPAFILYTSGTTKDPKGVTHTHAYTFAARMQAEYWLDARPGDLVWCTAGTGWAKSIWNALLGPWSMGAEIVMHEGGFDPDERLELIERLGVTVLCQSPTEYRLLAKHEALEDYDLRRLRHAVSAGEPLNPEVIKVFQDTFRLTIYDGYGQTENSLLACNRRGTTVKPGSMGLPTPGHEVAVIASDGTVAPDGTEGDIALRGHPPTLFTGYWQDKEATKAARQGDWYLTGDRAVRDEDGYLWFTARADDVITSAGYRIGPFEVESALLEHPAVAESGVVGRRDADRGQIVKAFVVLKPGYQPGDALAAELQEHVKAITAPYKYPREIEFVASLPKTASGKIRRSELREREQDGVAAARPLFVPAATELLQPMTAADTAAPAVQAGLAEPLETAPAPSMGQVLDFPSVTPGERQREDEERARAREELEAEARRRNAASQREADAEAERLRDQAEARARAEAEAAEAERLRREQEAAASAAEAAAAEQARAEAEARARAEAEAAEAERLRREQEAAAAAEAAAAEQARAEAEARARAEAEAAEAERLRREQQAAAAAAADAAAAEQARAEAERRRAEVQAEQERAEAEARRRRAEEAAAAQAQADAEEARRAEERARQARAEEEARKRRAEGAGAMAAPPLAAAPEDPDLAAARARAEAEERRRTEIRAAEERELQALAALQARVAEEERRQSEERAALEQAEAEAVARAEAEAHAQELRRLAERAEQERRVQDELRQRQEELRRSASAPPGDLDLRREAEQRARDAEQRALDELRRRRVEEAARAQAASEAETRDDPRGRALAEDARAAAEATARAAEAAARAQEAEFRAAEEERRLSVVREERPPLADRPPVRAQQPTVGEVAANEAAARAAASRLARLQDEATTPDAGEEGAPSANVALLARISAYGRKPRPPADGGGGPTAA